MSESDVTQTPPPVVKQPSGPSPLKQAVAWLIAILLALFIGFGLAYFLIAVPAQKQLASVSADLTAREAELTTTNAAYGQAKTDLETTRAENTELKAWVDQKDALIVVLSAEMNTAVAIRALSSSPTDNVTARQALEQLVGNMEALMALMPGNVTAALKSRADNALAAFPADSALPELNALFTNLLLLSQELQAP